MPLFEFVCLDCDNKFEELVSSTDTIIKCSKCGSENTIKQFSTFASNAIKTDACASCKPSSSFT